MNTDRILMAHGSGGLMSQRLIEEVFKKAWHNPYLDPMLDGAVLELPAGKVVMSTDSFVITPIFFPGGDIGKLSVCGTVNDLVACGARPLFLSSAFIIEEGFPLLDLEKVARSMAATAQKAGVKLVTGDTKVVEKGQADGIFINTTGIGIIDNGVEYRPDRIKKGNQIIVTGFVGDHGLSILAQREGLSFDTPALSDCAALVETRRVLAPYGDKIKCMRDPTRGGLATVLNELAQQSQLGMLVEEEKIPVSSVVQGACAMLGLDPLYMANEGKMILIVAAESARQILADLHSLEEAKNAAIIGEVINEPAGMVLINTRLGAHRILGILEGEHIPRIC
ncbi:MAG: hydrogenase expression/formation protein HypE [Syntrophomonadaceae bacterium]|jgi:hydrogenase expression/formation protein HypE|nr:hydrogenase expression/formation protein HypE [Syntrophomonadaceae bacterium]